MLYLITFKKGKQWENRLETKMWVNVSKFEKHDNPDNLLIPGSPHA